MSAAPGITTPRLLALSAVLGYGWDRAVAAAGLIAYEPGWLLPPLAPLWILALWVLFATTLPVSLRWLQARPLLKGRSGCLHSCATSATASTRSASTTASMPRTNGSSSWSPRSTTRLGRALLLRAGRRRGAPRLFDASLALRRRSLAARHMAAALCRFPSMTARVVAAI